MSKQSTETIEPVDSSSPIGSHLKKARETQGLSIDQVASLTRIQAKFIRALEAEDFQALPERVFVRGFVRTYARSLGVNEEDALRRFAESSSTFYQEDQQTQDIARVQLQQQKRGKLNRNLIIIMTIAILVALAFLLPRQQQSSQSTPMTPPEEASITQEASSPVVEEKPDTQPTQEPVEVVKEDVSEEIQDSAAPSTNELESSSNPVEAMPIVQVQPTPTAPTQSTSTDPLRLEIEATQLTWVVVKSDSTSPQEALLQPGQMASWEAQKQFLLTLGNAAGVDVRLNGELQGPFGKPGEVVREVVLKP